MSEVTPEGGIEVREGWICPVCRRGLAPNREFCDHGGVGLPMGPVPALPSLPYWYQGEDCGCPPNRVCHNAACPRRLPVTCTMTAAVYEVVGGNEVRRIMPQIQIDGGLGCANVEDLA